MASPFTVVKGDEFTRLTPAGIIRCLQVQDPLLSASIRGMMFIHDIATSPMAKYWVVSPGRYYVKA
jgi:hypothetical protein